MTMPGNPATLDDILASARPGVWGSDDRTADAPIPVRVVRNGDVPEDRRIRWQELPVRWVNERELRSARVSASDTLLVSSGYIGKSARLPRGEDIPEPVIASNFVRVLRPSEEVMPEWLFWLLGSSGALTAMKMRSAGTSIVNLQPDFFTQWHVPFFPPLPEQRAIAAVLDGIDEAIERTGEVIDASERVRDALLHELLTRGLPGRHSEWADVPGLGTVPASWDVVRLGEVCSRPKYGANTPALAFDPALPRYVRITDITDDGRLLADELRSAEPSATAGYELEPGDLLFARSGSVGRTYLYRADDGPCVYAGYLIRFRALPGVAVPEFLERCTRSQPYRRWVASMLRAGAQPNINAAEYASLRIPLPPLGEQRAIAAALDGVDARIEGARGERAGLQSLQASAADALLTGRVRVQT